MWVLKSQDDQSRDMDSGVARMFTIKFEIGAAKVRDLEPTLPMLT